MSETDRGTPSDGVRHEPIVSETLVRGAERQRERADGAEEETLEPERESLKRHGDALETGTGSRQGAVRPGERPGR